MQQTETYKLKLIDTDDEFSPKALNENAKTLEKELARVDAALGTKAAQSALAALTGQVAALDMNRLRFKYGSYTGTGENGKDHPTHLEFDFKPLVVVISLYGNNAYGNVPWVRGQNPIATGLSGSSTITWKENGISWYAENSSANQLNYKNNTYYYFALGIAE